jgi:hypothetical protein
MARKGESRVQKPTAAARAALAAAASPGPAPAKPPVPDQYTPLFSVTFPHDFYTRHQGLCADLRATPTPDTAAMMRALGLIFRSQDGGFTVSILGGAIPGLAAYLRRTRAPDGGFWTRLSFMLTAGVPRFFDVTAIAPAPGGARSLAYATNRSAPARDPARLCPDAFVSAGDLYPVASASLALRAPAGAAAADLADISGAVVRPAPPAPGAAVVDGSATLDLRGLDDGLYTARVADAGGAPIQGGGFPKAVLLAPSGANGVAFVDILLTQPEPGAAGLYPLAPLFDPAAAPTTVSAPAYQLPFQARSTIWSYYVISQAPGTSLLDLKIEGKGAVFERQPDPPPLPNGALAALFTSTDPLPLTQTATPRFRLTGTRRDADAFIHPVQVASLPAAPSAPVWPGADASAGRSEMYVYV